MTVNYGLAPRSKACWVCKNVASPEDVTLRLIGATGMDLPTKDAIEYLTGIGHSAVKATWVERLKRHRGHVRRSMEAPGPLAIAPAKVELGAVTRVESLGGAPSWVRAPERAIDLGLEAQAVLAERLEDMGDTDLISVARLGITAAGKMGDWEAKGRRMHQVDVLMRLASGFTTPSE